VQSIARGRPVRETVTIVKTPEWSSPPSASSCEQCDVFASEDGFFSVAADCMADDDTPSCLATLISSLGTSRPASFTRQGILVRGHDRMPGVIIGGRSAANVTGAYAFDPGFWPGSRGGMLNELPACQDESVHALARRRLATEACSVMTSPSKVNSRLRQIPMLNCRFSGLEAMVEQHARSLPRPIKKRLRQGVSDSQSGLPALRIRGRHCSRLHCAGALRHCPRLCNLAAPAQRARYRSY
jgi:hypothetical protein